MRGGGDIYSEGGYWYPPFLAFASLPFSSWSERAARMGWFALNIASIVGLARAAWLCAGGLMAWKTRRDGKVAALGAICVSPYILNALAHQQVDVFISFLIVTGCLACLRGRSLSGAVLIGLAAACKGPPLLFAGYFIWRRNWRAAGLIVLVAIGANLMPDLLIAPPDGQLRLVAWIDKFAVPAFTHRLGSWNGISTYNQSLSGTTQRMFTTSLQATPEGLDYVADVRPAPETLVKLVGYGLMLALAALSIVSGLRGQALARDRAGTPSHTALEFSAMSLLTLLMSPMTDLAHMGSTLLPVFCLARLTTTGSRRIIVATLTAAVVCGLAVNKDLVGRTAYDAFLWGGIATYGMLALWFGCVWALARGEGGAPVAGFTTSIFPFVRRFAITRR
jgi:hypothetical protein